jgi:hypothetical protein
LVSGGNSAPDRSPPSEEHTPRGCNSLSIGYGTGRVGTATMTSTRGPLLGAAVGLRDVLAAGTPWNRMFHRSLPILSAVHSLGARGHLSPYVCASIGHRNAMLGTQHARQMGCRQTCRFDVRRIFSSRDCFSVRTGYAPSLMRKWEYEEAMRVRFGPFQKKLRNFQTHVS